MASISFETLENRINLSGGLSFTAKMKPRLINDCAEVAVMTSSGIHSEKAGDTTKAGEMRSAAGHRNNFVAHNLSSYTWCVITRNASGEYECVARPNAIMPIKLEVPCPIQ